MAHQRIVELLQDIREEMQRMNRNLEVKDIDAHNSLTDLIIEHGDLWSSDRVPLRSGRINLHKYGAICDNITNLYDRIKGGDSWCECRLLFYKITKQWDWLSGYLGRDQDFMPRLEGEMVGIIEKISSHWPHIKEISDIISSLKFTPSLEDTKESHHA